MHAIENELKEVRATTISGGSQYITGRRCPARKPAPERKELTMSEPKPKLPPLDPQPRDPYPDPYGPEPDEPDPDVIDPMQDPLPA
jgi:hypothetical protein